MFVKYAFIFEDKIIETTSYISVRHVRFVAVRDLKKWCNYESTVSRGFSERFLHTLYANGKSSR